MSINYKTGDIHYHQTKEKKAFTAEELEPFLDTMAKMAKSGQLLIHNHEGDFRLNLCTRKRDGFPAILIDLDPPEADA